MDNRWKELARLADRIGRLNELRLDEVERLVAKLEWLPGAARVEKESDARSSHSKGAKCTKRSNGEGPAWGVENSILTLRRAPPATQKGRIFGS